MKLLYSIVTLLIFSFCAKAQINIVPNPGFELKQNCQKPLYWYKYTTIDFGATGPPPVLYYNKQCFFPASYHQPLAGDAYFGMTLRFALNNKVYIAEEIPALDTSRNYEVSFSVLLKSNSGYAINGWGAHFYINKWTDTNTQSYLPITPQVSYPDPPITDTLNWTRLKAIYKPDSAYTHIVIGSFLNDFQADVVEVIPIGFRGIDNQAAFYFIDSVVVRVKYDPIICKYKDLFICPGDTIRVPFVFKGGVNSGNTFSVQLSKATDSLKALLL